jgi:hypothetical protein
MWFGAFPEMTGISVGEALSTIFVASAIVVSAVAFTRGVGPQYELRGSRTGLLLALASILSYFVATSLKNDPLHVFSVAGFYLGSVLYLGGPRPLIATLPAGLIVASLFAPMTFGLWGLVYLDGLSWAMIVTSAALIWDSRRSSPPPECTFCYLLVSTMASFCVSCGRQIAPLAGPSSRRLLGFLTFAVAMLSLMTFTVPLMTPAPTIALVGFGLGGPQIGNHFAPLPGWNVKSLGPNGNGTDVSAYSITKGKVSLQAFLSASQSPKDATAAVNKTMAATSSYSKVPSTVSPAMVGYIFKQKGADYVGLLGTFSVSMLNGSNVLNSYLGVVLTQSKSSFAADNGSALFSAARAFIDWTASSAQWSAPSQKLLSIYQTFTQLAFFSSFAGFSVVLFTIARNGENAKIKRLESMFALGQEERAILDGFGPGRNSRTGEQLRDRLISVGPTFPISNFYSSLEEVARRGLIAPIVTIQDGRPKLFWRRLV